MKTLSTSKAIEFVRKSIDELEDNASVIFDDMDTDQFVSIVEHTIPEAIDKVHLLAPVNRLGGVDAVFGERVEEDVLILNMKAGSYLRLVVFESIDGDRPIFHVVNEDTSLGMAQKNPYTRGSYMSPILVKEVGSNAALPTFKYYSLKPFTNPEDGSYVKSFVVVPRAEYQAPVANAEVTYMISAGLEENILNYLVGMVLEIYKDNEHAKVFMTRALEEFQA